MRPARIRLERSIIHGFPTFTRSGICWFPYSVMAPSYGGLVQSTVSGLGQQREILSLVLSTVESRIRSTVPPSRDIQGPEVRPLYNLIKSRRLSHYKGFVLDAGAVF